MFGILEKKLTKAKEESLLHELFFFFPLLITPAPLFPFARRAHDAQCKTSKQTAQDKRMLSDWKTHVCTLETRECVVIKPVCVRRRILVIYLTLSPVPLSLVRCYFSHNRVVSTDGTSHEAGGKEFLAFI